MSEKFDVVVVGGGPAGLSTAYFLAEKGFEPVVIERGPEPGSKNVFGGRIYSYVLDKYFPGWRKEAPIERWVRKERMSITCESGSVTLDYVKHKPLKEDEYDSFTAFLSKFTGWLSEKAEEKGAMVLPGSRVEDIVLNDQGYASGVVADGEKIEADYIVIAEGVNTLLSEKLGIRSKPRLETTALGVKEVIRLGKEEINKRFGLEDWEGVAHFFIGGPLKGIAGGGFLYTMGEYVTIGAVVRLSEVNRKEITMKDIAEQLRLHPAIYRYVKDGVLMEYSAHLTREGGLLDVLEKPYGPGYLVVGDAAGFILNTGFTIRGVDLAIESGRLAAEAISKAHEEGKRDAETLSVYKRLVEESVIYRNLREYRNLPKFLENEVLYRDLPDIACEVLGTAYTTDEEVRRIYPVLMNSLKSHGLGWITLFKLFLEARRSI
ncbi:MAG: FAD-dependent oxidoreductase [Desulfurococcales archaeon]|nr:FAD-dependent oxidoreductase [Desulfurococcales archaeon]MEB3787018.1 FAD-dependent oxidoreductase [Desulfurococcales archaeon]